MTTTKLLAPVVALLLVVLSVAFSFFVLKSGLNPLLHGLTILVCVPSAFAFVGRGRLVGLIGLILFVAIGILGYTIRFQ